MRQHRSMRSVVQTSLATSVLRAAACAGLVVAGCLAFAGAAGAQPAASHLWHSHKLDIYATYYGWYTNTPPGCATAYAPYCAGGLGTYGDPITFASDAKEFRVGTLLYYPAVKKYFRMGDECTECTAQWNGTTTLPPHTFRHVDLWIGGKGGTEFASINCEDALTQTTPTPFIVDPRPGLPVSPQQPLFNARTGRCYGGATASATYGRYQNVNSGTCLEGPTTSTAGSPAKLATCTTAASEDIEFNGAFFIANGLCLAIDSVTASTPAKTVSPLEWTRCTGSTREQWETGIGTGGGTGTIEWIQYIRCVDDVGPGPATLKLAACNPTATPAHRWSFTAEPA